VEAIGQHALGNEVAGEGVKPRDLRLAGVESGIEDADLKSIWKVLGRIGDAAQVERLVQRGQGCYGLFSKPDPDGGKLDESKIA
jgi:hypothetical protein